MLTFNSLNREDRRRAESILRRVSHNPAVIALLRDYFIGETFKPKPLLMPKAVWRFFVGIVVRG